MLGVVGLVATSGSTVVSCANGTKVKDVKVDFDSTISKVEENIAKEIYGEDTEVTTNSVDVNLAGFMISDEEFGFVIMFSNVDGAKEFKDIIKSGKTGDNISGDAVPLGNDDNVNNEPTVLLKENSYAYLIGSATQETIMEHSSWEWPYIGTVDFN